MIIKPRLVFILVMLLLQAVSPPAGVYGSSLHVSSQSACPVVINTPRFTIAWGWANLDGNPAPIGSTVIARSPRGDIVGCAEVTVAGNYPAMYIYGEDGSVTPAIAGMRDGEAISFMVQYVTVSSGTLVWHNDKDIHRVDLSASGLPVLAASFFAIPLNGLAPLTVHFTNNSYGYFDSVLWDFGDGTTSVESNPTHIFTIANTYTVKLTVSGSGHSSSLTKNAYINAYQTYSIGGQVRFWNGSQGVLNTVLSINGSSAHSTTSDLSGNYQISTIPSGSYTLTPAKLDETGSITAYDASLVLQHSAGLIQLSGYAAIAADVNQSGTISALDASYILQKAAGLISGSFPGTTSFWIFDPVSRTYSPLLANQNAQDFTAVLLGDPSGNYSPELSARTNQFSQSELMLKMEPGQMPGDVIVSIWLLPGEEKVYSVEVVMDYDPSILTFGEVTYSLEGGSWMRAFRDNQSGVVQVAFAGTQPLIDPTKLLSVSLHPSQHSVPFTLKFLSGQFNEGEQPILLDSPHPGVGYMCFLPFTTR